MAESKTNPPAASTPAASTPPAKAPATPPKRTFEVRAKDPTYSGIHPVGLQFRDGVARTDNAIQAHACLELGYTVLDAATGKEAWPKKEKK